MSDPQTLRFVVGSELPDKQLTWRDSTGNVIDFSTGWTFTLKIATPTTTTKSSGITGAATAPNIKIVVTAAEWDALPAGGPYLAQLWAHRTSDNKDRVMPLKIVIDAAIT